MSTDKLSGILHQGGSIVCLLGRGTSGLQRNGYYSESFSYDMEEKYGLSPDEIFSRSYYNSRPEKFFEFYREEMLKKRGVPNRVHSVLRQMEEDGRLKGIVTRGLFNQSGLAGCRKVFHLYGTVDENYCPRCGKRFSAGYVLEQTPVPHCDNCGAMLHPGVVLAGERLDVSVMTQAANCIANADVLLVLGCRMNSRLGSMSRYFTGDQIVLVKREEHFSDSQADIVCIGDLEELLTEAYPAPSPLGS